MIKGRRPAITQTSFQRLGKVKQILFVLLDFKGSEKRRAKRSSIESRDSEITQGKVFKKGVHKD